MKLAPFPRWAALSLSMMMCALAGKASADENTISILKANGCNNCHAQSEQIVGPAFDAVHKKYEGQKGALDMLVNKVRLGGTGVWGQVAMPPNPQISDADLRLVLKAILAGESTSGGSAPARP
jgi:cytochrome c